LGEIIAFGAISRIFRSETASAKAMASPTGFEPVASGLGILRSILLSYGEILAQTSGLRVALEEKTENL
jgi:hypothetical protein